MQGTQKNPELWKIFLNPFLYSPIGCCLAHYVGLCKTKNSLPKGVGHLNECEPTSLKYVTWEKVECIYHTDAKNFLVFILWIYLPCACKRRSVVSFFLLLFIASFTIAITLFNYQLDGFLII